MTKEFPIPLFVAQHHHRPEDCPAAPCRGMLLLSCVSAATAARHGVTIQAEAFFDQEHLLLLVVQAPTAQAVHRFLACVPGPGQLQVRPARTAEEAVQRGGCGLDRRRFAGWPDDRPHQQRRATRTDVSKGDPDDVG